MSSNINQIIFENINEDYSYGMYSDFKVIIHTKSSYINITQLCKSADKRFDNWLQNNKSVELINYVNENELSKHSTLKATFTKKAGGTNEILALVSGTYAHPLIVPQVAQWISPKFAIMVSKIINEHLVDEYLLQLDEKDGKIESLEMLVKKMNKKMDKMTNMLDEQNIMLDEQSYKLDDANDNIEHLTDQLIKKDKSIYTKNKVIDIATDQRVPSTRSITKTENFIVMKSKSKDNNNGYRYRVVAGLRNYTNNACEKLLDNDFKEIFRLEDVNNSKNVLHRLKEQYKKNNILDFSGSRFSIVNKKISQTNLIKIVNELFEERKSVETESSDDE